MYWPPIVIKHIDCSSKKEATIGAAMFSNTEKFLENETNRSAAQSVVESIHSHHNGTESDPLLVKKLTNKISIFRRFRGKNERRTSTSKANRRETVESKFTWWTKFYNSLNHEHEGGIEKHRLRIFDCELEEVEEFSNLTDWAEPMKLLKGTNTKKLSGPKDVTYGLLKCNIRVIKTGEGDNSEAVVDMRGNR